MTSKTVEVTNKIGFHARPVSLLIESAKKYQSKISISKGEKAAELNSIVSIMKLQVKMGDMVTVAAEGADEADAVQELVGLIEQKFGEE